MIREKLEKIINHEYTEKFILVLILINIFLLIISTVEDVYIVIGNMFYYFDYFCVIVFTIEFLIRLIICRSVKQVFSPFMIIDFLSIAPFYLGDILGNSAIYLRIVRLSRLLRLAKLARYSTAFTNIVNAFKQKKEELTITFGFFFISVIVCGILMFVFEHQAQPDVFSSVPRSCYFAIVTFTTVGYGDFSPITDEGRIVTSIMAILGACIHGLLIGVIGTAINTALKIDGNSGKD